MVQKVSELPGFADMVNRVAVLEQEIAALKTGLKTQAVSTTQLGVLERKQERVCMVVFSHSLDKLLAAMNIATGAASSDSEVSLFFTFWATSALRKGALKGKRTLTERMFGWMLPSGFRDLKLSTMNFGGLGTAMIRRRMKEKRFSNLEELFGMARELGVKISVCEMSMDLMGMKAGDLMDYPGLEVCGVSTFLANATKSDLTLFI